MTGEGKRDTEPWIESKGAKYAYAYDKGGALARFFGVGGIPDAILVDPQGKVVWRGHPMGLKDGDIEKALKGALPKPVWEWPASAKVVQVALQKRQYSVAMTEAGKLSEADGGPTIVAALKSMIDSRVKTMNEALAEGNLLAAQDSAATLVKELDGLPEKADAEKTLAAVKADKNSERVLKAQKQIRDIRGAGLDKRKEIDKAIDGLKKVAKDYSGTYAEKEAKALIETLEAKKRNL